MTLPDMTTPSDRFRTGGGAHGRLHRLFGDGPWTCNYCRGPVLCSCDRVVFRELGPTVIPPDHATLDHVISRSRGGPADRANLVVACHRCNCSKGTQLYPEEWLPRPRRQHHLLLDRAEQGEQAGGAEAQVHGGHCATSARPRCVEFRVTAFEPHEHRYSPAVVE